VDLGAGVRAVAEGRRFRVSGFVPEESKDGSRISGALGSGRIALVGQGDGGWGCQRRKTTGDEEVPALLEQDVSDRPSAWRLNCPDGLYG
jgi:hypothetical protein